MSSKKTVVIPSLYVNGLIQGIGFTTIPAAGNFLTSAQGFNLTSAQYGALFLPMILGAILASYFGGLFGKRRGVKSLLLIGGLLNILSMIFFPLAGVMQFDIHYAYFTLMLCMLFLGLGFGANLTGLNTSVIQFFPNKTSTAVTALHSCLGIGTAIGPLLFSYFLNQKHWELDGLTIAACYFVLFIITWIFFPSQIALPQSLSAESPLKTQDKKILLIFIAIAFLYGICETTFGNWGTIYLHDEVGLGLVDANYALSIFWSVVTLSRILVFLLSFTVPTYWIYRIMAPIILLSLVALQMISHDKSPIAFYSIFAMAGLGCSAFLPLTVSFAGRKFLSNAEEVSGEIMALYMFGYGVASIGIGLLNRLENISFQFIFFWLAIPVLILAMLTFYVTRKKFLTPQGNHE